MNVEEEQNRGYGMLKRQTVPGRRKKKEIWGWMEFGIMKGQQQ